jgi:hypothetical protein
LTDDDVSPDIVALLASLTFACVEQLDEPPMPQSHTLDALGRFK